MSNFFTFIWILLGIIFFSAIMCMLSKLIGLAMGATGIMALFYVTFLDKSQK